MTVMMLVQTIVVRILCVSYTRTVHVLLPVSSTVQLATWYKLNYAHCTISTIVFICVALICAGWTSVSCIILVYFIPPPPAPPLLAPTRSAPTVGSWVTPQFLIHILNTTNIGTCSPVIRRVSVLSNSHFIISVGDPTMHCL
jgi:phosphatidylglycerophosphate synthase